MVDHARYIIGTMKNIEAVKPNKVDMAWEWNWPHKWKNCPDVNFSCDLRMARRGDHSPGIWFFLVIANVVLIDCGYYNIHHEECDENKCWGEENALS